MGGGGGGGLGRGQKGVPCGLGGRRGCPVESFLLYSQLLFDCLYCFLKSFCNILDPDQDRLKFGLDQDPISLARLQYISNLLVGQTINKHEKLQCSRLPSLWCPVCTKKINFLISHS